MIKQPVLKDSNQFRNPFLIFPIILVIAIAFSLLVFPKLKKNQSPDSPNQEKINQIFQNNDVRAFSELTVEIGPQKAYELVKQRFPNNNSGAHDFAHIIGIVAHESGGIANLKLCDTAYNYGCYHGFIESFISRNTVAKVSQIEDGCIALGPVHAPSCLHGIGHGVMVDASYSLDNALENCSVLKQTSQIYCWDGVFMERIVGSMQAQEDKPTLTKVTLQEPCDSVKTIYREQCWRNQVAAWFQFFNAKTKDVGAQCSLVEPQYQKTCFESLGLLVTISFGENTQTLISSCQVLPQNQISDDCLIGAMKELLFEGKKPNVAAALCDATSTTNRNTCLQTYNDHLAESQARFGR